MIEIIPAIDIIEGKCVRLSQGDYEKKKVYNEDPLEVAKMFQDNGIRRLHVVDLDGAKAKHIVNHKVLERIASSTSLIIDFGGGIKSDEDIEIAFNAGAAMVTGGSIAARDPGKFLSWFNKYGKEKIILGADVKNKQIAVSGWLESTTLGLFKYLDDYCSKGIEKVICTDISKDGMLEGPSFELYDEILKKYEGIYLIASGGISKEEDIKRLDKMGVPGVIIGKALYENKITLTQLKKWVFQ